MASIRMEAEKDAEKKNINISRLVQNVMYRLVICQ